MLLDENHLRCIPLRKGDLLAMKKLYEKVMSAASYGLFFRTGQIFGTHIARASIQNRAQYFEIARQIMIREHWVKEIRFQQTTVITSGSVEVHQSPRPTCHILRGVISKIFEGYYGQKFYCHEKSCESQGEEMCIFVLRPVGRKGV